MQVVQRQIWYKMFCSQSIKFWGCFSVGGAVASWLVPSTSDRAVLVRVLAVNIVLCSWARHEKGNETT